MENVPVFSSSLHCHTTPFGLSARHRVIKNQVSTHWSTDSQDRENLEEIVSFFFSFFCFLFVENENFKSQLQRNARTRWELQTLRVVSNFNCRRKLWRKLNLFHVVGKLLTHFFLFSLEYGRDTRYIIFSRSWRPKRKISMKDRDWSREDRERKLSFYKDF